MTDHAKLRELAEAAGGDEWHYNEGHQVVWFGDGDSALTVMNPIPVHIAHDNLGTWPEILAAEDVAAFSAAANPATVIALLDEIDRLKELEHAQESAGMLTDVAPELWGIVRRLERGYDAQSCAADIREILDANQRRDCDGAQSKEPQP